MEQCGHGKQTAIDGDTSSRKDTSLKPGRKNKRKMKDPQKRKDFSIKRFCPDSPVKDDEDSVPSCTATPSPDSVGSTATTTVKRYSLTVPSRLPAAFSGSKTNEQAAMTPSADWLMSPSPSRRQRKNYKNMTRERRIEANARERTRVHTISAAFESLRRAVPSYSYNQRLSKLAILRIACCYILSLSRLAHLDYSHDQSAMSFAECVDLCTDTIQAEGRVKRRH